jgi:hypothetical protein
MAITTLHRISELESLVAGFETTSISRWGKEKLIQTLNESRSIAIANTWMGGTKIHPSWQQKITIPFNERNAEGLCYNTFPFPYEVIKGKKLADGCVFVGNHLFTVQYDRVNTTSELLDYQNHPVLNRVYTQRVAAVLEENMWKLYSKKFDIKSLGVSAIFADPTSLPYFNISVDEYPIDQESFDFVKGYTRDKYLREIESTPNPPETISGGGRMSEFSVPNRRR